MNTLMFCLKENSSGNDSFPEKGFYLNNDDKSFSETDHISDEIKENQDDYSNIGNIEEILNKKGEPIEDVPQSTVMLTKKRKKGKIFNIKKQSSKCITYKYKKSNYINRWITAINKSYIDRINEKIKEKIKLYPSIKNIIFHTPSYEDFSEKLNIKENRISFLNKSMKDILKDKKIKKRNDSSNNKKDNSDFIQLIEETNDEELMSLLNMKYIDVIKEFYESNDCILFYIDNINVHYERTFMKRNKKKKCKSLFEKYGLIDVLMEK